MNYNSDSENELINIEFNHITRLHKILMGEGEMDKKKEEKMKNNDKRKVSTDALETLGTIIDEHEKRDAIHLAVEPVVAQEKLYPAQDVGADGTKNNPVGIVDPFLKELVNPGQRFWLVIYPRPINSLRHVWTHPAFPDEIPLGKVFKEAEEEAIEEDKEVKTSKKWIEEYCKSLEEDYLTCETCFYDEIMQAAKKHTGTEDGNGRWILLSFK